METQEWSLFKQPVSLIQSRKEEEFPRIPTPLLPFNSKDYSLFYEPAEDTFLLLDALNSHYSSLHSLSPTLILEIGSGSGCVSTFLQKLLPPNSSHSLAVDINWEACLASIKMSQVNKVNLDVLSMDLVSSLLPRSTGLVDLIIFNPPYVVTESSEVGSKGISASWAGGLRGRQVLDRLLPFISSLLSPTGMFYLLLLRENDPLEIRQIMKSEWHLESEVVLERSAGMEKLSVLRFWKGLVG